MPAGSRRYSPGRHHLSCSASPDPGEPGPSSWTGQKISAPRAATCPSALAQNRQAPVLLTQPIPEEGPGGPGAGIQAPAPRVSPLRPGLLWSLWLAHGKAWPQLRAEGPISSLREVRGVGPSQPVRDGAGRGALGWAEPSEASFWNHWKEGPWASGSPVRASVSPPGKRGKD